MKNTFYRPTEINFNEFENIIGKLEYDLHLLKSKPQDEWNVYCYFYNLSKDAQSLNGNSKMRFLGMADPRSMPSDARVDYFYRPTYIATAIMMKAVLLFPSLLDWNTFLDSELEFDPDIVKQTLASCMLGCTGREFDGAGVLRLKDCIDIFKEADADEFLEKYPDMCPEFTKLYKEKKAFVESGKVDAREAWFSHYN